jgi:hypothetical protein
MPDYAGVVIVDQRPRNVRVTATTSHLHVAVDDAVSFDKRFFVNTSEREASFDLAGRPATVRWDGLGVTVRIAGTSVELGRVAKGGATRPALTAAEKETILARQTGGGLVLGGAALLSYNWFEITGRHHYRTSLAITPWLILGGLVALLRPRLVVDVRTSPRRGTIVAAVAVLLVVGYFFTRWFIRIALGPGWEPAGLF